MTPLRHALVDYLVVHRALGFKLRRAEKLLQQFLTYVELCGETQLRLPSHALNAIRIASTSYRFMATKPTPPVPDSTRPSLETAGWALDRDEHRWCNGHHLE